MRGLDLPYKFRCHMVNCSVALRFASSLLNTNTVVKRKYQVFLTCKTSVASLRSRLFSLIARRLNASTPVSTQPTSLGFPSLRNVEKMDLENEVIHCYLFHYYKVIFLCSIPIADHKILLDLSFIMYKPACGGIYKISKENIVTFMSIF